MAQRGLQINLLWEEDLVPGSNSSEAHFEVLKRKERPSTIRPCRAEMQEAFFPPRLHSRSQA